MTSNRIIMTASRPSSIASSAARPLTLLVAATCSHGFARASIAQCPPGWLPGAFAPGANGYVAAIARTPGGEIIAGGNFTTVGGVTVGSVARYTPLTNTWAALGTGIGGSVLAITLLPSGDVIVGGQFISAGGVPARNIARYAPSTNSWSALGAGTNDLVRALVTLPGGDVIAGGYFTMAGTGQATYVARYAPSTNSWSALGGGTNSSVFALAVLPGGDVVVGGGFYRVGDVGGVGGITVQRIARLSTSSNTWSVLGGAISVSTEQINALAILHNGDVVAGGVFPSLGGVTVQNIARYSPSSNTWFALGSGTLGIVDALAVLSGGDVIAGGNFGSFGGVGANRVARYSQSSGSWYALGSGISSNVYAEVGALAELPGGDLIAGGSFTLAGGNPATNLARYSFGNACPADFNCSTHLEVQDIFDFLTAWFALDPRADFNGVSGITTQDIFDFLAAWFAGCG